MIDFEVKIHRMGGGFYQTKYPDPKTGKRKRKRFSTMKEAKNYKRYIEGLVQSKGFNSLNNKLRVEAAMEDYLSKFPDSKVRERKQSFNDFMGAFSDFFVGDITTNDLQEWMKGEQEDRSLSNKTMNSIKSCLNNFFKYLRSEGIISSNPMMEVKFSRYDTPRKKRIILSVGEVRTLLKNAKTFSPEVLYPICPVLPIQGEGRRRFLGSIGMMWILTLA